MKSTSSLQDAFRIHVDPASAQAMRPACARPPSASRRGRAAALRSTARYSPCASSGPPRPAARRARGLLLAALCSCAHAPDREATRVDSDWIRPRLEEAARAVLACARQQAEGVVEIELGRDGRARAWIYPSPPAPEQQACADRVAATVPLQPSNDIVRIVVRADGQLLDPVSPRARALALRARAVDQVAPVEQCRRTWQARAAGAGARISVLLNVGEDGSVAGATAPASTLDATTTRCVLAAAGALRLPPLPGTYRYSYLLSPGGTLVGAPDVDPIDRQIVARAVAAQRRSIDACMATYRTPGRVLLRVRFGNDGAAVAATVERETGGGQQDEADLRADACLRQVAGAFRVLPFDGPPADETFPFTLR